MLKSEVSSSQQTPIATIVPPSPPTTTATAVVDSNPLASAQAALQEAIQRCQDPSLSDLEKSKILLSAQTALQEAATKLAGGAITSPPAPEAVPATPPTVAEETKTVFSTKNDDLLKEILFKLKDASGDAKFGLKESLEKEKVSLFVIYGNKVSNRLNLTFTLGTRINGIASTNATSFIRRN